MIYDAPPADEPLTQGDILDACPVFGLDITGDNADLTAAPARWQERVIVLTQACDLAQTKTSKVLVALVHPGTSRTTFRGDIHADWATVPVGHPTVIRSDFSETICGTRTTRPSGMPAEKHFLGVNPSTFSHMVPPRRPGRQGRPGCRREGRRRAVNGETPART